MSDYNCNHLVTRYDLGNTYCAKCNRWLYAGMSKPESVSPAPAQPERPICQSCKETIHLREDGEWAHEDNAMECFIGPHSPKAWPLRFRRGVAYERPAAPAQEVKWYVKKPIPLVAKQWSQAGDHDSVIAPPPHCTADSDMRCEKCGCASGIHGWIQTLEGGNDGAQLVCPGDWIITGIRGEHYPCKPDIFADMYYEEGADNYVAWLKYNTHSNGETSIRVCDSDTKGAFKVYRQPVPSRPSAGGESAQNEKLKRDLQDETLRANKNARASNKHMAAKEAAEAELERVKQRLAMFEQAVERGAEEHLDADGLITAFISEQERINGQLSAAREALGAIAEALKEPAGGEYWTARKLLDKYGIFHDDLSGERVLNALALAALNGGK